MSIEEIQMELELAGLSREQINKLISFCKSNGFDAVAMDKKLNLMGYEKVFTIYDDLQTCTKKRLLKMDVNNKGTVPNEIQEEKQIKNAVIDLLHNNNDVTHDAISKATGISMASIQKHNASIQSMLSKLKKVHTSPNFKR